MQIQLSDHFSYSRLLRFTFPAIVMMVFTCLYGVVDGLFVANYVGKSALAAVNFSYPIVNILATFGYMFGTGGSALVAKTLGEGKKEKANQLFSLFVYICTAVSLVFVVVGFLVLRPLMAALGAEGAMLEEAVVYGNILLITMPMWNLQFLFQIFFVTAEKPKLGLYVTLLAGCTNMVLDALFVAVFGWGLLGAAWATAISQIVGGGLPLIYFFMKNSSLLRLGKTMFDSRALLKGTTNGLSELVSGVSGSLVATLYNVQLLNYAGEAGVAAYGVRMYIAFVFVSIFLGYSNGVAPVIGYHYGAQNHAEMHNLLKKSIVLLGITSVLMLIISEGLAEYLVNIFTGYDAELYALTLRGFKIFAVSFLFSGMAIFGSSFFTALNNGVISAILSFLRTIVFQVVCVMIFPIFLGIDGIWYSLVVAEILAFSVTVVCLLVMRKEYHY